MCFCGSPARDAAVMLRLPARLSGQRQRAVRDGLSVAGVAYAAFFVAAELTRGANPPGLDARAYWAVGDGAPYAASLAVGQPGAFLYAPPMALAFAPASLLPWPVFLSLWFALLLGALVWMARGWSLAILAFIPVLFELYYGNVNLLIAAAIVLGFRYPGAWAFVLFTKVTPGVGLLWFVFRREWRQLAGVAAVTFAVGVVSFVLAPGLWSQWAESLRRDLVSPASPGIAVPLWARTAVSVVVVWFGARTDRPWTVPVAAMLALPVLWVAGFSVAVGAVPLLRHTATSPEPQG